MHYGWDAHVIIDLAEKHPKIHNVNALSCDYTNRNVLSLSTVEHMLKREYKNGSDQDSIIFINKIVLFNRNGVVITFDIIDELVYGR